MSKIVTQCIPYLKKFCKLKSKKQREQFIRILGDHMLKAVTEIAINTLAENVPLKADQKRKLFSYRHEIRKLASHRTSRDAKKRILVQKGGAFLPLLVPIIATIISQLV